MSHSRTGTDYSMSGQTELQNQIT